jgi:hypothetical protein
MALNVDKVYITHWSKLTNRKEWLVNHLSQNNIDNYISLLTSHLDLLNHLFSINNNIHKQVNDSNKKINNAISQFETILNISSKKYKYNCNLCDYHSNNKKDFDIHQKKCC